MNSDTLRRLDHAFHFRAHQFFGITITVITAIIIPVWILRQSCNSIFTSTTATADMPLTFPSFEVLDKLRRPKLHGEKHSLLIYALPAMAIVVKRGIARKMEYQPEQETLLQSSENNRVEGQVTATDLPEVDEIWTIFHLISWRGYRPQHILCAIENTFVYTRKEYGIASESTSTTLSFRVKRGLLALFVWVFGLLSLALAVSLPLLYLRLARFLVEEPKCRLYSELFSSSSVSSLLWLNVQEEPLFPDSTVLVQEDGQVVVNGTILYTQGMDRALFTVCAMENVAIFAGGLVGLMLAYQVILRWCWFGAKMIQKVRRGNTAENEKAR